MSYIDFFIQDSYFIPHSIKEWCNTHYTYYYVYTIHNTTLYIATQKKTKPYNFLEYVHIITSMRNAFPYPSHVYIFYIPAPFKKHGMVVIL